jgi:hypothetical protein
VLTARIARGRAAARSPRGRRPRGGPHRLRALAELGVGEQHDLGVGGDHRLGGELRERRGRARGDVGGAEQRQQIADEGVGADREQRAVELEEDARPTIEVRELGGDGVDAPAELLGERLGAVLVAGELAEEAHAVEHARDAARLLDEEHGHPEVAELLDLLGLVRGHQHEVGRERERRLGVRARVGDALELRGLGRVVGELVGADDAAARADREQDLGDARRVADDALRGRLDGDARAERVRDGARERDARGRVVRRVFAAFGLVVAGDGEQREGGEPEQGRRDQPSRASVWCSRTDLSQWVPPSTRGVSVRRTDNPLRCEGAGLRTMLLRRSRAQHVVACPRRCSTWRRPVLWLTARHRLEAHSCGTAPDSHRLPQRLRRGATIARPGARHHAGAAR